MNTYREIFIDYENNSLNCVEEINFAKVGDFESRKSLDMVHIKPKGISLSLGNYYIFGIIEFNTISLTVTNTSTNQDTKSLLTKKYRIICTDVILDSVSMIQTSEDRFVMTIFTLDGHIRQIDFDGIRQHETSSGSFNKAMNIITVEYLDFVNSSFFALGSTNGVVYLLKLENIGKGVIKSEIVDEIKKNGITDKISNLINLSIFSQNKRQLDAIKSIKHMKNNLVAFITEEFNFKIYNYKTKKEIHSVCLIKNRTDERLVSSKINYYVLSYTEDDVRQSRSKCFIFTVYLEYNLSFVLVSFEVWFANIPEFNINLTDGLGMMKKKDFDTFFDYIELGSDLRIKNTRVYKLNGALIDMINYDKKIWVLSQKPHYNEGLSNSILSEDSEILKYSLKIFSINKYNFTAGNSTLSEEPTIIFYDSKMKNLENIINQIRSGNEIETKLFYDVLLSNDYFDKDMFIHYFNTKLGQKFTNKTQILNFLEKSSYKVKDLDMLFDDLMKKHNENGLISMGFCRTIDIDGLTLIRKKGISFLKTGSEFEYANEVINSHEYFIRNLIFNKQNKDKHLTHNPSVLYNLQRRISHYISLEAKNSKENVLFVLVALLRVYLTESHIVIKDEKYLENYFLEKNECDYNLIDLFIADHFEDKVENQYRNLNFLDFIHKIILETYLNNKGLIEEHIQIILRKYDEYFHQNVEEDIERMHSENPKNKKKDFFRFNSKFIEILTNVTHGKIQSLYNINRDLMGMICWVEKYAESNMTLSETKDKVKNNFLEATNYLILSNHRFRSLSKEQNILDHTSIEKELNYVESVIFKNLYQFGPNIFHETENRYIDYIIFLTYQRISCQNIKKEFVDELFLHKDYKLMNLILKFQNKISLENILLEIICSCHLNDNVSMKDLLNKYFSILIDIANRRYHTGFAEFERFEKFYKSFFERKSGNLDIKSQDVVILGYYYLEERIKFEMSEELKYEFYFYCYSFIYPNLLKRDFNRDEEKKILEDFLVNMLKSCIDIDIDLALSCYSTIIKNFEVLKSTSEIHGIFGNYIARSPENISFVKKLLTQDCEFIDNICGVLEKNCEKLKVNTKIMNLLKHSLKLEAEFVLTTSDNMSDDNTPFISDSEGPINFFSVLFGIYSLQKDHQNAARIMYSYSEAIDNVIKMIPLCVNDLIKVFKELLCTNDSIIYCLSAMSGSTSASNINFLHKEIRNSDYYIDFISLEGIIKENKINSARIDLLQYLVSSKKIQQNEEMQKIKNVDILLNHIFRYRLFDILLDNELVYAVNTSSSRKIIINMTKILSSDKKKAFSREDIERKFESPEDNQAQQNIPKSTVPVYNSILIKFYTQIVNHGDCESIFTAIESHLFYNRNLNIPEFLLKAARDKVPIRLCELLLKYSKIQELIDISVDMINSDQTISIHLYEIANQVENKSKSQNEVIKLILSS